MIPHALFQCALFYVQLGSPNTSSFTYRIHECQRAVTRARQSKEQVDMKRSEVQNMVATSSFSCRARTHLLRHCEGEDRGDGSVAFLATTRVLKFVSASTSTLAYPNEEHSASSSPSHPLLICPFCLHPSTAPSVSSCRAKCNTSLQELNPKGHGGGSRVKRSGGLT